MDDLLTRLRGRGLRLTAQRRAVAEVLVGDNVHLTADEVHHRASERLPEISRATVYNTLSELVALGEVLEVSRGGRARLYDPNIHPAHQHLVCDRCGSLRDVAVSGDLLASLPETERAGFAVNGVEALYHGLCRPCQGHAGSA